MKTFSQYLEEKKNWIQDAVGKPGALNKAAKREKESVGEYCENPPSEKARKRCQLRKTLKGLNK